VNAKQARDYASAVIGLWYVSRAIMPGRNTAAVIEAMGKSFDVMIKATVAIRRRDARAIDHVLSMGDADQWELFNSLNDSDLEWLESMLRGTR
jgi:hypothetical protein